VTIAARVYQEREAGGRPPEDDFGSPGDPGGTDSQHSQRGRLRKSGIGMFFFSSFLLNKMYKKYNIM